jgi:predicted lipoprotein with Yx(FWY)xxD motif
VRVWSVAKGPLFDHHAPLRSGAPPGRPADPPGRAVAPPGSRSRRGRSGLLRRPLVVLTLLAAAGTLAAGCGSSYGSGSGGSGSGGYGSAGPTSSPAGRSGVATVAATSSNRGMILVDGSGRTLYLFAKDQPDQSACSGACATAWPIDQSSGTPKAGSGVKASLLGTIRRADGTTQVTYDHHPLYYYAGDSGAGQQNGQAINAFGAAWYVVAPTGEAVTGA